MADKKQWIGKDTFPTIWIWICVFFNIIGILAVIMLIVAEVVIIVNDFNNYIDQYGHSYPARHYVGEEGCGYVDWTNAPKHLGSAVWMILFQLSILVFATMVIASDLAWRKAKYSEWGNSYVTMFYSPGIMAGENNKGLYYYVIANAFLKAFLVILYMSQTFYGLKGGSHAPPDNLGRVNGGETIIVGGGGGGVVTRTITTGLAAAARTTTVLVATTATTAANAAATVITGPNGGSLSARELSDRAVGMGGYGMHDAFALVKRVGPDPNDPGAAYGTELWAQWAGWIVLGSIVPSIIAFIFLVPWAAAKNEEKKDEEKK